MEKYYQKNSGDKMSEKQRDPIIVSLENDIAEYDSVYLIDRNMNLSQLSVMSEKAGNKVLFYLPEDYYKESEVECLKSYRMITREEEMRIEEIYRLYDFSDRFHFLTKDNRNFGNLFNFVNNGVLTEEQAYEAMFM